MPYHPTLAPAPAHGPAPPAPPQITELTSELTDERNTGESASQLLDAETAERLRAEKEMKDLQVQAPLPSLAVSLGPPSAHHGCVPSQAKYDALKKQMESMEMEVMEARLIRAAELNGELDDDDSGTVLPLVLIASTPWGAPWSCHPPLHGGITYPWGPTSPLAAPG